MAVLVSMAGCAAPFAPYAISSSNVSAIRAAQRGMELGAFAGTQNDVSCRFRRIGPTGSQTFAQYIRAAFNEELVIAGTPASRERSMLSLKITDVAVDCGHVWSSWTIEAEVRIANQAPFPVKVSRSFDGSFLADVVQTRASQAFAPTVQAFIAEIVASPAYVNEFGSTRRPPN